MAYRYAQVSGLLGHPSLSSSPSRLETCTLQTENHAGQKAFSPRPHPQSASSKNSSPYYNRRGPCAPVSSAAAGGYGPVTVVTHAACWLRICLLAPLPSLPVPCVAGSQHDPREVPRSKSQRLTPLLVTPRHLHPATTQPVPPQGLIPPLDGRAYRTHGRSTALLACRYAHSMERDGAHVPYEVYSALPKRHAYSQLRPGGQRQRTPLVHAAAACHRPCSAGVRGGHRTVMSTRFAARHLGPATCHVASACCSHALLARLQNAGLLTGSQVLAATAVPLCWNFQWKEQVPNRQRHTVGCRTAKPAGGRHPSEPENPCRLSPASRQPFTYHVRYR